MDTSNRRCQAERANINIQKTFRFDEFNTVDFVKLCERTVNILANVGKRFCGLFVDL